MLVLDILVMNIITWSLVVLQSNNILGTFLQTLKEIDD